jgi:hypothetical protein
MPVELCPRCKGLRSLRISTTIRTAMNVSRRPVRIESRTFTCGMCGVFVRSEENEQPMSRRRSDEALLARATG